MNDIKKWFYEYINNSLNETLTNFKKELLDNPKYRYSSDEKEKIKFLKEIKGEFLPENVNPYLIKGVNYTNGIYTLNEPELKELIDFYNINLKDSENGLFYNNTDKTKAPAWRSFNIVVMSLIYCLELQIINEIINDLSNRNFKTEPGEMIFLINSEINSEAFFKYLVDEWLTNEPHKLTALQHITYILWHRNNENETPFKIISTLKDFALYWNSNYKHLLELKKSNPKLNLLDETNNHYYSNKFAHYLDKYIGV